MRQIPDHILEFVASSFFCRYYLRQKSSEKFGMSLKSVVTLHQRLKKQFKKLEI